MNRPYKVTYLDLDNYIGSIIVKATSEEEAKIKAITERDECFNIVHVRQYIPKIKLLDGRRLENKTFTAWVDNKPKQFSFKDCLAMWTREYARELKDKLEKELKDGCNFTVQRMREGASISNTRVVLEACNLVISVYDYYDTLIKTSKVKFG